MRGAVAGALETVKGGVNVWLRIDISFDTGVCEV